MSAGTSRKSGAVKGAQRYQNETAYKHNKNSKLTRKITATPITGLCQPCLDKIEWRKKFRKYKPLTTTKKCVDCLERKIKEAYHVSCDDCAKRLGICCKCRQQRKIMPNTSKTAAEIEAERIETQAALAGMNERQRRSYLRKLENGEKKEKKGGDDGEEESGSEDSESEEEEGEEEEEGSDQEEDATDDDENTVKAPSKVTFSK